MNSRMFLNISCLLLATTLCVGCGSITDAFNQTSKLTIGMMGVFSIPSGASGNNKPRSATFTLNTATVKTTDESTYAAFAESPLAVRIIDRPQIIIEFDLTELVGKTIQSITVGFSPDIVATGKYQKALGATLAQPTTSYDIAFAVPKGKKFRFDVQVAWQNTVTRDDDAKTESLVAPTLSMAIGTGGASD